MVKSGDKFIIEVEEVYVSAHDNDKQPQRLYRIKGFNSLVFDESGLDKLENLEHYKLHILTEMMKTFTTKRDNGEI